MTLFNALEFAQLRSIDDEPRFFSLMGRFFASAHVRRECGGYPLNDGPLYRWFVAYMKADARVLGFISIDPATDVVRIREGYVRPEVRGRGIFRELRGQTLAYIDGLGLASSTRVPQEYAPFWEPHGFQVQSTRGSWTLLKRLAHAQC